MNIFEATALQLAWLHGRDEPEEQDHKEAAEMVQRWNQRRIELGLKPWE